MGFGAPSATPCLAGFFALRCFSLITIWVTPESWVVKPITSLPHWFYTRILRVPKCFSPQAFSLTPKSAHNLGNSYIQISSAALAIPLLFTQAIFGENAAKQGLRSVGVPYTVYGSLFCFVLAILAGLIYQWASVRRVWDDLHGMQRTPENAQKPGYRE